MTNITTNYGDITVVRDFNPENHAPPLDDDVECPISQEPLKGKTVVYHNSGHGKKHPFLEAEIVKWVKHVDTFWHHKARNKCIVCMNDVDWSSYIKTNGARTRKMKFGLLVTAVVASSYFLNITNPLNLPLSPFPLAPRSPHPLMAHPQCPNIHSDPAILDGFSNIGRKHSLNLIRANQTDSLDKDDIVWDLSVREDSKAMQFLIENELIDLDRFIKKAHLADDRMFSLLVSKASEKEIIKMLRVVGVLKDANRVAKLAKKLDLIQRQNKTPEKTVNLLRDPLETCVYLNYKKTIDYLCSQYDISLDTPNQCLSTPPLPLLPPRRLIAHPDCPNVEADPAILNDFSHKGREHSLKLIHKNQTDSLDEREIVLDLLAVKDSKAMQFLIENELIDLDRFIEKAHLADDRTFSLLVSLASEENILKMLKDVGVLRDANRVAKLAKKLDLIQKQNKTPEKTVNLLRDSLKICVGLERLETLEYLCSHYDFSLDTLNENLQFSTYCSSDSAFRLLLKHGASIFSSERTTEYAYRTMRLPKPSPFRQAFRYFFS